MKVKALIEITLDEDIVQEKRKKGYDDNLILSDIKTHLSSAIGNSNILNYEYVDDYVIKSLDIIPILYKCNTNGKNCYNEYCSHKKPHEFYDKRGQSWYCPSVGSKIRCEEVK